ncbi:hypothetical protein [Acinetobacter bereziniae]
MKAPAMLVTPTFGVTSTQKIVDSAQKQITSARKSRLEQLAQIAKNAYKN